MYITTYCIFTQAFLLQTLTRTLSVLIRVALSFSYIVHLLQSSHPPGLLLGLDKADDVLHPEHEVTHHVEEAELVSRVEQTRPPPFTGFQKVPPCVQDFALPPLNIVSLIAGIC